MPALATKRKILEDGGYVYNFDRQVYVNRKAKKVFSVEFVDDNTEDELQNCVKREELGNGWKFYFSSEPSQAVRHELERVLG